ncbi:MAG: phosphatase PAP2 family protein [bacterium]
MKGHRRLVCVLFLLLLPGGLSRPVAAQSPYRITTADDLPLVMGVAAAGGLAAVMRSGTAPLDIAELSGLRREDVPSLDRFALDWNSPSLDGASDIGLGVCLLSPVLLGLSPRGGSDALVIGTLYAESLGLALSTVYLLKELTRRVRPFAYQVTFPRDEGLPPDARRSFPSAHAAGSFTAAAFLTTVYADYHPGSRWKTAVGLASFGTAAVVGHLRVRSGQHFPTDTVAGALLGAAAGWLVPRLHREGGGSGEGPTLHLAPGRLGVTVILGGDTL